MRRNHLAVALGYGLLSALLGAAPALAQNPAAVVSVDAAASRHAISPLIYGVAFGDTATLNDLKCTLNREGGDNTSTYNWQINADNRAASWYFESLGYPSSTAGEWVDTFIGVTKGAGAEALVTIPMLSYVATLGPGRDSLASFSVAKYGPQTDSDPGWPDAGNGISTAAGNPFIVGNDPLDAYVAAGVAFQQGWVQHLVGRWGQASAGGLKYYMLDNEPTIWFSDHRDVHPVGPKMDEIRDLAFAYAEMIKAQDSTAQVVGFDEWGWPGLLYSGYDQQYASEHGYCCYPDRDAHGGRDYYPYLLDQFHQHDEAKGMRYLDLLSTHWYPEGGEFSDDVTPAMQQLRNRSTRSLWDPDYTDESWINDKVYLIPRMKQWVTDYYPGTPIALTEYNWGAESHINGATAQADVLGIFGREGLDAATRWEAPPAGSPAYNAMKIYRNADGLGNGFGDTSVSCSAPSPDHLSAFAALRASDGALTVMVVNKDLSGTTLVTVSLGNFSAAPSAKAWQLTAANAITRLADVSVAGGTVSLTLPAPSVTLFVIPTSQQCTLTCTATVPATGNVGQAVAFASTATPSGCSGTPTYDWDFGDASAHGTAQNPSHSYALTGTFNWSLAVAVNGVTCAKNGSITVAAVAPPVIALMKKVAPPLTIVVTGSNLQSGIKVYINNVQWASVIWKNAGKIKLSGGASLKAAVPKNTPTQFRFVNPDGGETTAIWQY